MAGADVMPLPDDVSAAVDTLTADMESAGKMVGATQVAAYPGEGVPGWIGESADAYTSSIQTLGAHALDLSTRFQPAIDALDTWSEAVKEARTTTIPGLHTEYDTAQSTYEQSITELNTEIANRAGTDKAYSQTTISSLRLNLAEIRDTTQADVLRRYREAIDGLDDAAQTAADSVQSAQNAVVDPSAVSSRDQLGAALFNDIPLVDGQAEWEYAQEVAPLIVAAMRDTDLTPEDLQAFHDQYSGLLSNPFIANALTEQLSPEEMLEFSIRTASLPMEDEQVRTDVLTQIGTAIVLASGGMDASNPDTQIALETSRAGLMTHDGSLLPAHTQDYASDLMTAGRATYKPWELSRYTSVTYECAGYELLSQLIGTAGAENLGLALGPAFFEPCEDGRSVAEDMVAWDAETMQWASLHGYQDSISMFSVTDKAMCDPMHAMYMLMDRPEGIDPETSDPVLVQVDDARLGSIMDFLSSDTPTGMDVNHDGEVNSADTPMNMTRYLTGGRTGPAWGSYYGFQDGGEQFGEVLEQASATEDMPDAASASPEELGAWRTRDGQATEIAANFMFGYQDGLDNEYGIGDIDGQDVYGYHNSNLRSWAGLILGPHLEGISVSLGGDTTYEEDGVVSRSDGHWIKFTPDTAKRLLGSNGFFCDLGFDNPPSNDNGTPDDLSDDYYEGGRAPALDNLLIKAKEEYEEDLLDAIAGESPLSVGNAANRWAPVIETLFTGPADASEQAAAALNARNEKWQKLITAGIGTIPFGDIVDDKTVNYFISQAKSNAMAPTLESFLSTDHGSQGGDIVAKESMAEKYMQNVLSQYIIETEDFSTASISPAEYCEALVDDKDNLDTFVNEEGQVIPYDQMTTKQRDAFDTYLQEMGDSLGYSSDLDDIEGAVNAAIADHGDARIASK